MLLFANSPNSKATKKKKTYSLPPSSRPPYSIPSRICIVVAAFLVKDKAVKVFIIEINELPVLSINVTKYCLREKTKLRKIKVTFIATYVKHIFKKGVGLL